MEIDKNILYDLYFNQNMSQNQIAKKLNVAQSTVSVNCSKYGFTKKYYWSDEEILFLEENWGKKSMKCIAKNLNKSVHAVNVKAKRLKLGGINTASEYITASELARAIGYADRTVIRWIKQKGLIGAKRKLSARPFWRIDLRDFWKWAFDNKDLIDWRKIKENSLGLEPKWVKDVRKASYKYPDNWGTRWNKEQDKLLTMYWNAGKTANEIAELMNRTPTGAKKRAGRLGLDKRVIEIPWKSIEDEILISMKIQGFSDYSIAEELGRGRSSVTYRKNKLIKLGLLNLNNKKDTKPPTKANLVSTVNGLDNKPLTL